jgi:hypothetical protein
VTLTRGLRVETVGIRELEPAEAAPVLKRCIARVPITRPFFDATSESDLRVFEANRERQSEIEQARLQDQHQGADRIGGAWLALDLLADRRSASTLTSRSVSQRMIRIPGERSAQ